MLFEVLQIIAYRSICFCPPPTTPLVVYPTSTARYTVTLSSMQPSQFYLSHTVREDLKGQGIQCICNTHVEVTCKVRWLIRTLGTSVFSVVRNVADSYWNRRIPQTEGAIAQDFQCRFRSQGYKRRAGVEHVLPLSRSRHGSADRLGTKSITTSILAERALSNKSRFASNEYFSDVIFMSARSAGSQLHEISRGLPL